MTKEEVLIYGMIVEADIFVDGHGTTDEDEDLNHKALLKVYGITSNTSDEEKKRKQEEFETDQKELVKKYRKKALDFLGKNE